jgi:hypothetical protein
MHCDWWFLLYLMIILRNRMHTKELIPLFILGWTPVTTGFLVLGLRMEGRPPAVEGRYEYIEKAAADRRKWVVLQLGGWGCEYSPPP